MPAPSSLTALVVLVLPLSACAAEFWVSPQGDDAAPGTRRRPFATLTRARDAVREARRKGERGDITVWLLAGAYRLGDTLVLTREDSAPPGSTTTFAAAPGASVTVTGTTPITEWRRLDPAPAALPARSAGHVWVADLQPLQSRFRQPWRGDSRQEDVWSQFLFFSLYAGGRRLPRARGVGFRPLSPSGNSPASNTTVRFPPGAVPSLSSPLGAELVVVPSRFWIMNILPVAKVDESSHLITTAAPCTYPMGPNGMKDRPSVWVENALEVLDQPGEWVLDVVNQRLYLWPPKGEPQDIEAPVVTELIRIEGDIDYEGPRDQPVRGLVFRGLTFTGGDRYPFHGRSGWGLQHDWEQFDRPTALVRLRGAEDCCIEECCFTQSGHAAIRLDLHARHNRITGNQIDHIGGAGVLLAGYGPGTKDVNRDNIVANNWIHDCGETYWASGAVFAWQSGNNLIAHNLIHDTPYTAILATGRIVHRDRSGQGECSRTIRWTETTEAYRDWSWSERAPYLHARNNRIEFNDIFRSMQRLGDGNCIYISGAGSGNRVVGNYCHDCGGKYMNAVIRCDDDQHQTLIQGNVIHRTRGYGEGIISKGDNDILNNVIADLRPTTPAHRGYIVFPYGDISGSVVQRNILYSTAAGQRLYHEGRARGGGRPPRLANADADFNLYWNAADPHWADDHFKRQRPAGIEKHSRFADPLFVDVTAGDFRFRPSSPAAEMGVEPIDVAAAGLEPAHRQRLVGRLLHTRIQPADREWHRGLTVVLMCDQGGADIFYTLDGSEPTRSSQRYRRPFELTKPATVHARAFGGGGIDLVGATAVYSPPPQPVREDFESSAVGATTPAAETNEDDANRTARVSDEQALSGKHSLRFVDGPGGKRTYNPHLFYRVRFREGIIHGRFAIRIDGRTTFSYQWRDYREGYRRGPRLQIRPGGHLLFDDGELLRLPVEKWIRFEVECRLGEKTFALRVELPDQDQPAEFANLPCESGFQRLDWVGFIANGAEKTTFYIDDIEIAPVE